MINLERTFRNIDYKHGVIFCQIINVIEPHDKNHAGGTCQGNWEWVTQKPQRICRRFRASARVPKIRAEDTFNLIAFT